MEEKRKETLIIIAMLAFILLVLYSAMIQDGKKEPEEKENGKFLQGLVASSHETDTNISIGNQTYTLWNLSLLNNGNFYNNTVIYVNNLSAPPSFVNVKVFYRNQTGFLEIYKIESLG